MRTMMLFVGLVLGSAAQAQDEPMLCVDTLDCGGFCGSESEVDNFLADCNGGPVGPCFSDCWNACLHSAGASSNGNGNGNTTACTLQCMTGDCPNDAAANGMIHAGHSDTCPVPDPAVTCFLLFDPVDCSGCTYSNGCFAAAAGFAGGQCQSVNDDVVLLDE